ncbi:Aste57867_24602 [Aphanomyces stellatus]|uniref:Aste57867_24602 protein n=1 Tax=Aphanomyces stellatus TaxID=120398 RepID=A0A485LV61_9STRA|nr:hypothetical protein As57867_024524 [Aphanomyces stellatus]VFU01240.1 Aste57867_24602 [Aphanomyces stellatus]
MMQFQSVNSIFAVLCVANVISYVFRNLVPASPLEFQTFIQRTLHIPAASTSVYFGLLESIFIVSYCLSILVFGYLSKTIAPLRLLAVGLSLWCASVVLCGLASPANNFYILLIGRLLSGIGDSAVQAITPPFLERYAATNRKNLWLGIFYGAIPLGTALSYFVGSFVTRLAGWQVAFYMCALFMAPLVGICTTCIPDQWNQPLTDPASATTTTPPSSISSDVWSVLRSPIFLTSSLGGSAFAWVFVSMATFGPSILIGAGTFPDHWAATVFGVTVLVCGVLGSVLGGILLDRASVKASHECIDDSTRLTAACYQQLVLVAAGLPFLVLTSICLDSPVGIILCLILGLTFTFATLNATTMAILLSVPPALQGLAVGLFSNIVHWVGDVPAPLVVGVIKDWYAPGCGSTQGPDGVDQVDPACASDANRLGLKMTLFWATLWLTWSAVLWFASWRLAKKQGQPIQVVYLEERNEPPRV